MSWIIEKLLGDSDLILDLNSAKGSVDGEQVIDPAQAWPSPVDLSDRDTPPTD